MKAVVCSVSDILHHSYFITVKRAHFSCSLHCLPSRSRTVSPTCDILHLQIHFFRPGQATFVKNSPTMSTGPLNLNHLCKFIQPGYAMMYLPPTKAFPSERCPCIKIYYVNALASGLEPIGIMLEANNRNENVPSINICSKH